MHPPIDPTPSLSIIIPCHDEAGNIEVLVAEILEVFGDRAPEIVVVDDCSADESVARVLSVKRTATRPDRVRVVRHGDRCGKSAAIWTGMRLATGVWAATLDGDGQNDPRDLHRIWMDVLGASASEVDIVCGRRKRRHDGVIKKYGSRLANRLRKGLLDDDTNDTACGLKLFRRSAFLTLPYFDTMHRFYPALIRRQGGRTREVLVEDRPRRFGRSKYGVFDRLLVSMLDIVGVYWLRRRARFPVLRDPVEEP